ncbi:MAG: hypothetical protein IPG17_00670 [Sandaracinaceae bacterium]|nr:hypothetical protein [Sandaracinaceae bacterium]
MRTLTSLCVLSFLVNLGYGIVLPVLPTLAHATPVDVGFMYSIFSAAKLVALLIGVRRPTASGQSASCGGAWWPMRCPSLVSAGQTA